MPKRKNRLRVFLLLPCLLLLPLSAGIRGTSPAPLENGPFIEVHGPDVVDVPATAKYVTYDGAVRKILRFSAALNEGEAACKCPNCCNGHCYVIIATDPVNPGGPLRILYIIWLEC